MDTKVESVVKSLATAKGDGFFGAICLALAQNIQADYVFIANLNKAKTHATTISLANQTQLLDNFTYELAGTPCENVSEGGLCTHTCGIQPLYPEDELLVQMGIEGYVGISLQNDQDETHAILVALFTQQITHQQTIETLFNLFAGLINKELEKHAYINKLKLTQTVIENSHEAILITNAKNEIIYTNQAFTTTTGYQADDVKGQNPKILSAGLNEPQFYQDMWQAIINRGHWSGELYNKRKDGSIFPERLSINSICNDQGKITHYVCFFTDITESKKAQETIFKQANFDPLTDLANRQLFINDLNQAIRQNKQQSSIATIVLDLDMFKSINESYGIKFGDEFLIRAAHKLKSLVSTDSLVAKIGGDSFAVLLTDPQLATESEAVVDRIIAAFNQPVLINNTKVMCTLTAGIALYPNDGLSAEELVKNASHAMYEVKNKGRNGFCFFASHMQANAQYKIELKNALVEAIKQQRLNLVFQPIVDINNHKISKFEALVRWKHNGTWVSPAEFIPIAEEFGLIKQLGEAVLTQACQTLKRLKSQGYSDLVFNINRSLEEFPSSDKHNTLWLKTITEAGLTAKDICFELTESALAPELNNNIALLDTLKTAGCAIALDDFGTGYSSLNYLRRFPVDQLKIDRTFIKDMQHNPDDRTMVATIIAMAKALGIKVVAEGVELPEQLQILSTLGCDYIQGFYFSKPLSEKQIPDFLAHFSYQNPQTCLFSI
ncbi:EAL domain-containing protein [Catenovulum sp. SM1970]|uniref:putative bifunctional diguanylate cyclase/phosphodiesterase n=1 Tax=Marinifaba aquimaris TaxID=2741323 RepID=UPI001573364D|nr:EAL domain-containing protein [Marinifaba aquimaris]NTS77249.1 EAL domain-containing protein [Marinifaba aquimaris]